MSENTQQHSNGKLPPISPTETQTKRVKKKKKPKKESDVNETGENNVSSPDKTETGDNKASDAEKPKASPRKKTRKTKKLEETEEPEATADKTTTGSKTSLIDKSNDESTPRKKKKKKKKVVHEDESHGGLPRELMGLEEDIVSPRSEPDVDDTEKQIPHSTTARILQSQRTEKLFIETKSGFKGETKARMAKKDAHLMAELEKLKVAEPPSRSTIDWALSTQYIFKTICLFLHGLTAGVAMWHVVVVYVLSYHDYQDFLVHYEPLAMPVQCMFYILLVLCAVSACDRFDLANHNKRSFLQAITLQSGAVSIPIYLIALVLSLSVISSADRMHLYKTYPELWETQESADSELRTWKAINTARGVAAVIGWIVLAITPTADRLKENLKRTDSFMDDDLELDPSMA